MEIAAYYEFQAKARGHRTLQDVERDAQTESSLYDAIILPWLPADRQARIYEVACGSGIFLFWLRQCNFQQISGSDSSEPQITLAQLAGFPVKLADSVAELLQKETGLLDCVVVSISMNSFQRKCCWISSETLIARSNRANFSSFAGLMVTVPFSDAPYTMTSLITGRSRRSLSLRCFA
jgi:hypothetical protein